MSLRGGAMNRAENDRIDCCEQFEDEVEYREGAIAGRALTGLSGSIGFMCLEEMSLSFVKGFIDNYGGQNHGNTTIL